MLGWAKCNTRAPQRAAQPAWGRCVRCGAGTGAASDPLIGVWPCRRSPGRRVEGPAASSPSQVQWTAPSLLQPGLGEETDRSSEQGWAVQTGSGSQEVVW